MASSRRQYPFHLIEPKWQQTWEEQQAFRAFNPGDEIPATHPFARRHGLSGKVAATQLPPKFYILDMFPYPSGAGLHVGHPEGYTATDILARYRRACGFNVLHPMGWDSFGLPAEQYAVKTGQHPRKTTDENIANFTRQIKSLGFSYDWSRELATTDPDYFKWTQWIFLKLYNSWFDPDTNKAEPIEILEDVLSENPKRDWTKGDYGEYVSGLRNGYVFTPVEKREQFRREQIDKHRLAYVSEQPVWWCEGLGTVLANEEVVDGKSEVGGFPVIRKPMRQWMLRISKFADRLLNDLETIDWSDSLKEMQRNWIGRSEGATVTFEIEIPPPDHLTVQVFTTRPDTLFGATYLVAAPEHQLVHWLLSHANKKHRVNEQITSPTVQIDDGKSFVTVSIAEALARAKAAKLDLIEVNANANPPGCIFQDYEKYRRYQQSVLQQESAIKKYLEEVAKKSDLERTELAKEKTGVFTGAYAINPVNDEKIPIWIADYVLASYGTGAIMAVPAHDTRDFEFAREFGLSIKPVILPSDDWLKSNVSIPDIVGVTLEELKKVELDNPDEMRVLAGNFAAATNLENADYCEECVRLFQKITCTGDATSEELQNLRFCYQEAPACFKQGDKPAVFVDDGTSVNSTGLEISITGLPTPEAKKKITDWLEAKGLGKRTINYKLRDWLFSRQRYWGEPFPIVWKKDAAGNLYHEALPESSLPLLPPSLEDYKPTPDGQPPLARAKDWVNLPDGSTRETNTMPQWAGSCWYYLRYIDAKNNAAFVGKDAEKYWMNSVAADGSPPQKSGGALPSAATKQGVDLYVGGTEHAVLHLLYARFWHKVLFDLGYVSTPEPFFKLVNQGLILGEDGQKMSKSRGNVVNPDDVLQEFGADAFRLYEMFMGPLEMVKPWNTQGVSGVYKFLGRVWRLFVDEQSETEFEQAETTVESAEQRKELLNLIKLNSAIRDVQLTPAQLKTLHACIKKVTEDLDGMRFNTAISAMMVFVNDAMTWETRPVSVLKPFLQLLAPFAPHLAEELWSKVFSLMSKVPAGSPTTSDFGLQTLDSLAYSPWPKLDPALLVEDTLEIPVQVNGKLRDVIKVSATATPAELEAAALANEKVKPFLAGKTIKKIIVLPKKLVNIVVT